MWLPTYHKRNVENINKLAPNTREKAREWYQFCVDNKIDILVYESIRSVETQKENVRKGASKTMKSYHIVGQALDFCPLTPNGSATWDTKMYKSASIQKAIKKAKQLGFEWGGDWKTFVDMPHLQYNYKGYGTDKTLTVTPYVKPVEKAVDNDKRVFRLVSGTITGKAAAEASAEKIRKQHGMTVYVQEQK